MFRPALTALALLAAAPCAVAQETALEPEKSELAMVRRDVFRIGDGPALPAAIAVNLGDEASFFWDSVRCQLLAAWTGDFLKASIGATQAPAGEVIVENDGPPPISSAAGAFVDPEFHGFALDEAGVPTFHYIAGNLAVSEKITVNDAGDALEIALSVQHSPTGEVMLAFPAEWEESVSLSVGKWEDGYLIIPKSAADRFTITIPLETVAPEVEITENTETSEKSEKEEVTEKSTEADDAP